MAREATSTRGENRYSIRRREPVLSSTVAAMPEVSGRSAPSTSMVETSRLELDREHQVLRALAAGEALGVGRAGRIAFDRAGVGRGNRVPGDAGHMRLDRAVAGEGERFDLDHRLLADADEADVAVEHIGLDLQRRVARHDAHDLLAAGDDLADIGDDRRLHPAGDRSAKRQVVDQGRRLGELLARVLVAAAPRRRASARRPTGRSRPPSPNRGRSRRGRPTARRAAAPASRAGSAGIAGSRSRRSPPPWRPTCDFDQLGAHVDPLLQRRHQVLLGRDRPQEHVPFGGLLRPLGVERGERRRELPEVGRRAPGSRARAARGRCRRARRSKPAARRRGLWPLRARPAAARSRPGPRQAPPVRRSDPPPPPSGRARSERRPPPPSCHWSPGWRRPARSRAARSP